MIQARHSQKDNSHTNKHVPNKARRPSFCRTRIARCIRNSVTMCQSSPHLPSMIQALYPQLRGSEASLQRIDRSKCLLPDLFLRQEGISINWWKSLPRPFSRLFNQSAVIFTYIPTLTAFPVSEDLSAASITSSTWTPASIGTGAVSPWREASRNLLRKISPPSPP